MAMNSTENEMKLYFVTDRAISGNVECKIKCLLKNN